MRRRNVQNILRTWFDAKTGITHIQFACNQCLVTSHPDEAFEHCKTCGNWYCEKHIHDHTCVPLEPEAA